MSEKMYTSAEARELAVAAAEEALARFAAVTPVPSAVSLGEAATMLKVSRSTLHRMNLRRNAAGKIPYSELRRAIAAR